MSRTYTIEHTVYKFDELPPETQQKAIERLYDINVDHDWWDFTYEDAKNIGLEITGFDLGRGCRLDGKLTESVETVCELILKNHGDICDTYKLAKEYLPKLETLKKKADEDATYDGQAEYEEVEEEFLKALREEYRFILQKEYEYLTSEDAIKETIEANDYEFDEKGNIA